MKVKMEATFTQAEVEEVMKREYVRLFGKPAEGYYLEAIYRSYEVEVCTIPDPEPKPKKAETPTKDTEEAD